MVNSKMRVAAAVAVCAIALGCEKASPTRPSGVDTASGSAASVTDARTGVTMIAARPASPANDATIAWAQQPIVLTVANGLTSNSSPLSYTFEVAGDREFARLDASKSGIGAGPDGTTSVSLDRLSGSRTYYWRVQVSSGSGNGPYSAVRSFTVGPEVVLGTPVLASPVNGQQAFSPLSLSLTNIQRTGPAGPIVYTVQVASDSGFGNLLFNSDVAEQGGGQTAVSASIPGLVSGQTYFWRAMATDAANQITTPFSEPQAFVVQSFNFAAARMWETPPDLAFWPETARITSVEFTGASMRVDFDRRDPPDGNRWPDQVPPGWAGPIQYSLGMCRNLEGNWHCACIVAVWYGRSLDDTAEPSRFWREWWYDGARWGPMATHRPEEGETVGVFVTAGQTRGRTYTRATCPQMCERSNVAFVPFTTGYAYHGF
jgi:hypothetical protein